MKKGIGISTIWIMSQERSNYTKFDQAHQNHLGLVKRKINHLLLPIFLDVDVLNEQDSCSVLLFIYFCLFISFF